MQYFLTGSYSGTNEPGIKLWQFNPADGSLTEKAGAKGVERPSYLTFHPAGEIFIACSETAGGELVSWRFGLAAETLSEISRQPSNGDHPAHASIDESGKWLLSVNYSGGNVNVFPLQEGGVIGALADSANHEGSGLNSQRQDAAHPHSVSQIPGTPLFLVPDLGLDKIHVYKLDGRNGKLERQRTIETAPGAGPRHVAFHPFRKIFYVLEELSSSLVVYGIGEGADIDKLQAVPLVPDGWQGGNTSAEVAVSENGKFLYASNRGHDSIAAFSVEEDGTLKSLGFAKTGGKGPRHFVLPPGGGWLIAANENSGSLTVLKIDETGMPKLHGKTVQTKAPVCVKYAGTR
ncbi:MAG TPA: lactonase family protein [Planococcus sp. (in: firmicutes)]|nr:lactonase family protein [Planococcus sp. (in: firmicutes)]